MGAKVSLYIEKYSRRAQELLLDFVIEDEFRQFRSFVRNMVNFQSDENQYDPSMLLIHECNPKRRLQEGSVLIVSLDKLLEAVGNPDMMDTNMQGSAHLIMAFMEIHRGAEVAALIDHDSTSVQRAIPSELRYPIKETSMDGLAVLGRLSDNFELRIWNVGQGNTNSISDCNNVILFDFGTSIYYSKSACKKILYDHKRLLSGHRNTSLIISHWDYDHIALLLAVDDAFLKKLCCVVYPSEIISLTAKKIADKIQKNCRNQVVIFPRTRRVRTRCGIQPVHSEKVLTLFTGETHRNLNYSGLLLELQSTTSSAMLTADHSIEQVWEDLYNNTCRLNKALHVVVPHHGASHPIGTVKPAPIPGKAVISVGSNNYGHPSAVTIADYYHCHYQIMRTDRYGTDITIHM